MTESASPAGWHPDPHDASLQRYWDGSSWTEQTAPRAEPVRPRRLGSERVVVSAPMSFAGSAKRMRLWVSNVYAFWTLGLVLLLAWWAVIVCWYVVFGVFLVPYRLVRRGGRKRKLADRRHQEMLAAVQRQQR